MYEKLLRIYILLIGICFLKTIAIEFTKRRLPGLADAEPCPIGQLCVSQTLCDNGTINTDGSIQFDRRISLDGDQCPLFQTCCSQPDTIDAPVFATPNTSIGCGYRNPDGVQFRLDDLNPDESQFGEFPWMVAVLLKNRHLPAASGNYNCGGSLISPQVVLTAAHCVHMKSPNEIRVRAGEWETNVKNDFYDEQDREVVQVIIHEKYNKETLDYGIALIIVKEPFVLSPHVATICLAPAKAEFDYAQCYATGWGKDQFENGVYQNFLKKIELPIVPHTDCEDALKTTRLGASFKLHETFLCAGGDKGKDVCTGDGGSPLVCPFGDTPNRYYQVGIVAWGIGCGTENIPGVYVSIPELRTWLDEQLDRNNIKKSFYTP